jgi:hypothetical protein
MVLAFSTQFTTKLCADETPLIPPVGTPIPRGFIVPSVQPTADGARITVDIFHQTHNGSSPVQNVFRPVTLELQAYVQVKGGNANANYPMLLNLKTLSDKGVDAPTQDLRSRRTFDVSYAELNAQLAAAGLAGKVEIVEGAPLYVYAQFDGGHQWGGPGRGGIVFMPKPTNPAAQGSTQAGVAVSAPPTELDVAYKIDTTMVNSFNENGKGLLKGGQVRSRLEGEGKFQVMSEGEFDTARDLLFKLANDPALASQILGQGWKITIKDRYFLRDASGNLQKDAKGFPVPDPMIDTYYDSDKYEAAKNDVTIRYRWTEGNRAGAWNIKPGMGMMDPSGVVYRIEYGVDTTDNTPEAIKKFAESDHALNPFRKVREKIPGVSPADLLKPSVQISDMRYKFLIEHTNNLAIEISLDEVTSKNLRTNSPEAKYWQIEMDIDHLAVASANTKNLMTTGSVGNGILPARFAQMVQNVASAEMVGGVSIHELRDLAPTSAVRQGHAGDFTMATQAISGLRDYVFPPKNWRPGAQKYAYAAAQLGLVPKAEVSLSVQAVENICGQLAGTMKAH